MVMEQDRAHQIDISDLFRLKSYEFGKSSCESLPDVVVGNCDSPEWGIHKETENYRCWTLIIYLVIVQVDFIDIVNIWKDHSQCFHSLIIKLIVSKTQLCILGVVIVIKVLEHNWCRFLLHTVVFEDVLDQINWKWPIFLLCLDLRHAFKDVGQLWNLQELVRNFTFSRSVWEEFHWLVSESRRLQYANIELFFREIRINLHFFLCDVWHCIWIFGRITLVDLEVLFTLHTVIGCAYCWLVISPSFDGFLTEHVFHDWIDNDSVGSLRLGSDYSLRNRVTVDHFHKVYDVLVRQSGSFLQKEWIVDILGSIVLHLTLSEGETERWWCLFNWATALAG